MIRHLWWLALITYVVPAVADATRSTADPNGDIVLRSMVLGAPLTLKASLRFAGAIYSLQWRGKEFLNAYDHGRELQTAISFDRFGECYNPTEAGSQRDASGPSSTSRLLRLSYRDDLLETTTDMAFWMSPGQQYPTTCGPWPSVREARNTTDRGDYQVTKKVHIGHGRFPNVLEYDVTLQIPRSHEEGTFELLTGYMPTEFAEFLAYEPRSGRIVPLSDGPGEQALPVVLSTPDRQYAMGVYAPGIPQKDYPDAGYGRFRFVNHSATPGMDTVKWNCVYRQKQVSADRIAKRVYVVIGTVEEVAAALGALVREGV